LLASSSRYHCGSWRWWHRIHRCHEFLNELIRR
jgi:hypothetical protein